MFKSKQTTLKGYGKKTTASVTNSFVNAGMKTTAQTRSENGALKYESTGDDFVDQFGRIGEFRTPRSFETISKEMELLWSQNSRQTLAFAVYLRLISRQTVVLGNKLPVQYGAGLKHEAIMRMLWISQKEPKMFYKNLIVFVSAGSWSDIFKMLQYDLIYNGWDNKVLDWKKMGTILVNGLASDSESNLIKKYLPQLKATSKCKTVEAQADTEIAKWLCSILYGAKKTGSRNTSYVSYRKLKSSGTAHEWQQLISQGKFDKIDFDKIHGRALKQLVNSKFLANQGLTDKYEKFITDPNVTEVKFTGFVHELFENFNRNSNNIARETIDKQFNRLVEQAKDSEKFSKFIVVRDTSSSMGVNAQGTKMSCFDLAKSLALYMSEFLSGPFANHWIEFNSDAKMHQWKGNTATEKWINDKSSYVGSTNFESVINLFAKLKQQDFADESDFPTGIICISDSEFNPSSLRKSNVESAKELLRNAGFSKQYCDDFVIVLWNTYRQQTFKAETYGFAPNVFYYSGFDASTIALLTGDKIKTSRDLFNEAVSQDIMHYLS